MEKRKNTKILVTNSSDQTEREGFKFGKKLKMGDVVCLYGNLGNGKTTFIKGLAKSLKIKHRIISPTFIIVRSYKFNFKESEAVFYHVDLYRLLSENDLESVGLLEIIDEKNRIIAIEWPEKLGKFMPKNRWEIYFKVLENDKREIKIKHE